MRFGERRSFGGGRRFGGSSSRFDRGSDEPKPIKVGEEYDVEIKETGSKGDGIARISNFVVFVNGAKLGEKLHIKITDVKERFAIGEKTGAAGEPAATESESKAEESENKETKMSEFDEGDEEEPQSSNEESEEE